MHAGGAVGWLNMPCACTNYGPPTLCQCSHLFCCSDLLRVVLQIVIYICTYMVWITKSSCLKKNKDGIYSCNGNRTVGTWHGPFNVCSTVN